MVVNKTPAILIKQASNSFGLPKSYAPVHVINSLCLLEMTKSKLKIVAITIGLLSLVLSFKNSIIFVSILQTHKLYLGQILFGNLWYTFLLISPLFIIGLQISSFGLFYLKKWGYVLANISLGIFIGSLLVVALASIFPNLLDFSIQLDSNSYINFIPEFSIEAFLTAIMAVSILVAINLKTTRALFK